MEKYLGLSKVLEIVNAEEVVKSLFVKTRKKKPTKEIVEKAIKFTNENEFTFQVGTGISVIGKRDNKDSVISICIVCIHCKVRYIIEVELEDLYKYNNGELVQNAFPNLSESNRELFTSHMCETCFDKVFGEE